MFDQRALGTSGLSTPPLVLGGNVFGWSADRAASFAVLDAFVAGGGTMIDTADVYSSFVPGLVGGESEVMIGDWLAQRGGRDDVLIATKVGYGMPGGDGLSAAWIERAVEDLLRRLRTDHIDLYFAHRDDDSVPLAETLGAFDRLVRAGKVRAIGASNYSAGRLAEALEISRANGLAAYSVIQPHYNLLERAGFEGGLRDIAIERKLGCIPYFSLAAGFLTGKYRTPADAAGKDREMFLGNYLNDRSFALVDVLVEVARDAGHSPAQLAIAWLAAQPGVTAPIAAATKVAQVEDLLGAMRLTLPQPLLDRLNEASAPSAVAA